MEFINIANWSVITYYCVITMLIIAYVLGSIPSAVWIGKKYYGIDIREHGSKNAGTTNMLRVLGKKAALPVFVLDFFKGFTAVVLINLLKADAEISVAWLVVFGVLTAIVSILDYILPSYMTKKFGGSKAGERGAMAGVLAGFIFGPVGIIVGPFVGALRGELINDSSDRKRAVRSGWGSFLSFFVGTGIKLAVSLWLTIEVFIDVFKHIF